MCPRSLPVHRVYGLAIEVHSLTYLDFADDEVIFAETIEGLVASLDVLSKESESLGFRVSWVKTKIQTSSRLLITDLVGVFLWRRGRCCRRLPLLGVPNYT